MSTRKPKKAMEATNSSPILQLMSEAAKPRNKDNLSEFFPTPLNVTTAFLRSGRIPLTGRFLEPCAGDGAIIAATERYCAETGIAAPTWTGVELRNDLATMATQRCPHATIVCGDALTTPIPARLDCILSNPPFSLAELLYQRLRPLAPYLVFLLRIGWLESTCRQDLLANDLPSVGMISPRPSFSQSGNDNASYAFCVWGPERRTTSDFFMIRTKPPERQIALL